MKYCIKYQRDFPYLDKVDEITITYNRKDTTLLDFLLKYKNKIINIYIKDEDDFLKNDCIKIFDAIATEHPEINFRFKLKRYTDDNSHFCSIIINNKIPHKYFFDYFVSDWDTLWGYINLKPASIYVTADLGFEIKTVAEILHNRGIEVRCLPNVAQSNWGETAALKRFFIRPEDIDLYEPYVDVCEFFGDSKKESIYYKIYALDKKWFGKLNEIIISFDSELDSRFLLPNFADRRLECGKRCLKGRGCKICEATEQLSAKLEEKNLIFKVEKE
jgi:hypothetical protein